ncbi:MAG: ABC transporter ATP-binding protein [Clostridia bacterium]|nr:ABC transporter ATP-binding protein [Clostridia bacterium]
MKDIHVSVQNLTVRFGEDEVLHGVSRDFESGMIHGIIGNNGSGKTVMFKCICGFLRPDAGRVLVDYEEIGRQTDFPQDTGIIIETPGFLPALTGLQNLRLLASLRKTAGEREIRAALGRVGLDPDLPKKVSAYSLGMRQRLGIAQAIMERPTLLILDEPFNGLDRNAVEQMRSLLMEMRSQGVTILLASHNSQDIDMLCDTVCLMDAGLLEVIRE